MKTKTTEEVIRLGVAAKLLLEDEAVQAVFQDMKAGLYSALDSMASDNEKDVMAIVRQLRAIRAIRSRLDSLRQAGEREQLLQKGDG